MIITGGLNSGAGHELAPPVMVRETVQEVMEAILEAEEAQARGQGRLHDRSGPVFAAPCRP